VVIELHPHDDPEEAADLGHRQTVPTSTSRPINRNFTGAASYDADGHRPEIRVSRPGFRS
jgi:hypothetical protein